MPTLTDRIINAIQAYQDWSPAECRQLHAITEEILAHVREGNGNRFIAQWCDRYLRPTLKGKR